MSSHIFPYAQAFKRVLLFLLVQFVPTFPNFFLENFLLSLLFYSKMSFTCNKNFFPRSLRSLGFHILSNIFFREHAAKHLNGLLLTLKGSLFSLYHRHSYYPAYLVGNFLFLTTHCDKFCTWKSPTIPTFFTPIIPTIFQNLYPHFPYFLLKGT